MDHAVAAEDVGPYDLGRAEAKPPAVRGDRLAVARGGAGHLRILDVADLHREEPARHHVMGKDVAQLLLVLGKEQRVERACGERREGFVRGREDRERPF